LSEEAIEDACNRHADDPDIAAQLEELAQMQDAFLGGGGMMEMGDLVCMDYIRLLFVWWVQ
jgi:hypothetical protein